MTRLWEADRLTLILITAIFFTAVVAFWGLINAVIVALVLAIVLMPLQREICRVIRPSLSSFVITSSVIALFSVVLYYSVRTIYDNIGYIREITTTTATWIIEITGIGKGTETIFDDITGSIMAEASHYLLGVISRFGFIAIEILIIFLLLFLLLIFGDQFYQEIISTIPASSIEILYIFRKSIIDVLYALFNVHVLIALIVFLLAIPFYSVLGYGHVAFWATFSGIFALIPIFGPVIIIGFVALYALALQDWYAFTLTIVIGWPLLCAIPDWYLRPKLMGKRAKVNGVLMFIAFFGGIAVMGVMGFILGPVFIALLIACYRVFIQEFRPKNLTTKDNP